MTNSAFVPADATDRPTRAAGLTALDHDSVFSAFEHSVAQFRDQPFLVIPASASKAYSSGALEYTYAEAIEEVKQLTSLYAHAKLEVGQRVALLLENRPAFLFHWLALNSLGISILPLNPDFRFNELAYLLEHGEVVLIVSVSERVDLLKSVTTSVCPNVPVLNMEHFGTEVASLSERPHATDKPRDGARQTSLPVKQRECALVYTSGTTGKPKGCILSNRYFLMSGARYLGRRGYVELEPGRSRIITPLPLFHINALASSSMGAIMSGSCIIQLDRFHPSSFWSEVVATGATGMHCLGVMPAMLLALPETENDRRHSLRYATAANVEPQHHGAFEARFGVPLIEGWSMTETGAGAAISADSEPRHIGSRCIGRVPDTLELRLVDESGEDVAEGQPGEVIVRRRGLDPALGFFSGYLKDPQATAHAWRDGWWHSGDVMRQGADGSLHFVDRFKNLIRRSGENISALEVENLLRQMSEITDIAVTAVPDPVRGEEVMACVIVNAGVESDFALALQIVEFALSQAAYYKAPGYIAFFERLPTTASQKIERGALKQLAATLLGGGGCFDMRRFKRRER